MSRRVCRNHLPAFKAKVALAALRGGKTLRIIICDGHRTFDFGRGSMKTFRRHDPNYPHPDIPMGRKTDFSAA